MSLNTLASRAQSEYNTSRGDRFVVDPASILLLIELAKELVGLLQRCREPDDALDIMRNPSLLQRRILRRRTLRSLGRSAYRSYGKDFEEALINSGKSATLEEVEQAYRDLEANDEELYF